MHKTAKRHSRFLSVSWLLARLWWNFDITRLHILRFKPKSMIRQIMYQRKGTRDGHWVFHGNSLSFVSADEQNRGIRVVHTPGMEQN